MLLINNLHVTVENKKIINGVNLKVKNGETHAIMGPNGSGKSTLSSAIAGREECKIVSGILKFKDKDLTLLNPEERAKEGIFVAFQYPVEIPGVSNHDFLQKSVNSIRNYRGQKVLDRFDFKLLVNSKIRSLGIPDSMLSRSVNVGFSGGEKKLNDILQMILLEPDLCILDETDSGLDIDTLKVVSDSINSLRSAHRSFVVITHYRRILDYVKPDFVHILYHGKIVKSGNFTLVKELEEHGYAELTGH